MKTYELSGQALDYYTALALDKNAEMSGDRVIVHYLEGGFYQYSPSTNWRQMGEIIDKLWAEIVEQLRADLFHNWHEELHGSKQIWFCRAVVARAYGHEVK